MIYQNNFILDQLTTFLTKSLSQLIYEGINSLYKESVQRHREEKTKTRSVIQIFQLHLEKVTGFTDAIVVREVTRMKNKPKFGEILDDLVKVIVRNHVIQILGDQSLTAEKLDEHCGNITTNEFVHNCYIQCALDARNNADLFWDGYQPFEQKRNQREIINIFKESINYAIMRMLPLKLILQKHLEMDYVNTTELEFSKTNDVEYANIKCLLEKTTKAEKINNPVNDEHVDFSNDESDHTRTKSEESHKLENNKTNEKHIDSEGSVYSSVSSIHELSDSDSNSDSKYDYDSKSVSDIKQKTPSEEKSQAKSTKEKIKEALFKIEKNVNDNADNDDEAPKEKEKKPRGKKVKSIMTIQSDVADIEKPKGGRKTKKGKNVIPPAADDDSIKKKMAENVVSTEKKKGRKKDPVKELIKKEKKIINGTEDVKKSDTIEQNKLVSELMNVS